MTSFDELKTTIRRNQLLGMWAAEKLGLVGADADKYAKALATDTIDPERNDMLSGLRTDFDAAGVIQSDEQTKRYEQVHAGSRRDAADRGPQPRRRGGHACPQAYDTLNCKLDCGS